MKIILDYILIIIIFKPDMEVYTNTQREGQVMVFLGYTASFSWPILMIQIILSSQ